MVLNANFLKFLPILYLPTYQYTYSVLPVGFGVGGFKPENLWGGVWIFSGTTNGCSEKSNLIFNNHSLCIFMFLYITFTGCDLLCDTEVLSVRNSPT